MTTLKWSQPTSVNIPRNDQFKTITVYCQTKNRLRDCLNDVNFIPKVNSFLKARTFNGLRKHGKVKDISTPTKYFIKDSQIFFARGSHQFQL